MAEPDFYTARILSATSMEEIHESQHAKQACKFPKRICGGSSHHHRKEVAKTSSRQEKYEDGSVHQVQDVQGVLTVSLAVAGIEMLAVDTFSNLSNL